MALTLSVSVLPASTLAFEGTEDFPAAGIALAMDDGVSITSVKADTIKENAASDSTVKEVVDSTGKEKKTDYDYDATTRVSTIKETIIGDEPAMVTVGIASVEVDDVITENEILEQSVNVVAAEDTTEKTNTEAADEVKTAAGEAEGDVQMLSVSEDEEKPAETAEVEADGFEDVDVDESQEGEYFDDSESSDNEDSEDDSELVSAVTVDERTAEEESFKNLVIARVNDYVNVRQEPSEESEIVGKLYNKSVGDLLEEAGDWYKIKSGNCTGYVKGEYVVTGDDAVELAKEVGTRMAVVTTTTLYVRKEPSTEAEVIGMVPIEDELTVSEELDGWAKVSVEEGDGYVSTEFVRLYTEFVRAESKEEEEARLAKEEAARKAAQEAARKAAQKQKPKSGGGSSAPAVTYVASGSGSGSSVANYALQFVGNPYVYGGSSLTNGTDCSGFVMSVYRNFGVSLPHSSGGDRGVGYDVGGIGNAQAGDIVCYSGHVGIYIGNGQIVHASTPSSGIKVSNANYRTILAVRRIF